MVFSSTVFLFLFLPIVFGAYFLFFLPAQFSGKPAFRILSNFVLLTASLFFYAWGEKLFVLIMLLSILANYLFGLWVNKTRERACGKLVVAAGVFVNLALLTAYKYANFLVDNLNLLLDFVGIEPIFLAPVHLPIGISFFTFQAMSYVIDVHRKDADVQSNPINVALYISLFPQLIAGPIVRYRDVAKQLINRVVSLDDFAIGAKRFIIGLGKKVLIANTVAAAADKVFAIPSDQLTPGLAWLGVICYTLQIYFDFSGYSDMAIGLGRMFGFRFLENFQWPYIAQSIKEFWRRWHISLSNWFRDYLYVPLGGNRCTPFKIYFNLVVVFFLCGLWHGSSWTFVIWGLYQGFFLVIERLGLDKWVKKLYRPLRHVYTMLVVIVGWVLFRSESLEQAGALLSAMAGFYQGAGLEYHVKLYMNAELVRIMIIGSVFAIPWIPWLSDLRERKLAPRTDRLSLILDGTWAYASVAICAAILLVSAMWLSAGTYNPFIYFRF